MPVLVLALLHKTATLNVDAEAPPLWGQQVVRLMPKPPPLGSTPKLAQNAPPYVIYMQYICSIYVVYKCII